MERLTHYSRAALSLLVITWIKPTAVSSDNQRDYCAWESFNATCAANEVITMTSARYGRMRVGRCVSKEYGYVGCYDDTRVLRYVDTRCSGRRSCSFPIADLMLQGFRPCPKDVAAYFDASYACVPVVSSEHAVCSGGSGALLSTPSGHIASSVSEHSRHGTAICPWRVTVQPGQRINVTLMDYGQWARQGDSAGRQLYCHKYATIREGDPPQETVICAAEERVKTVYISKSNAIQITIQPTRGQGEAPIFLLQYKAIGCARLRVPPNAELRVQDDTAVVTCAISREIWHLRCDGTRWTGNMGNCTSEKRTTVWSTLFSDGWSTSHGLAIVIGLGIALGVLIGVILLILAVICLRRRGYSVGCNRNSPREPEELVPPNSHYESKYGGTVTSTKYNSSSGYSSEGLLLPDPVLVDPRMGQYGESRLIWSPHSPLPPTLDRSRGRRPSQQSMGHIYESPDFIKNEGITGKDLS